MQPYVTHVLVEAHARELADQAQQSRLARQARAGRRPSRARSSAARLLVVLATRLDGRLQPAAIPRVDLRAGT
jgi:hypothetical protein